MCRYLGLPPILVLVACSTSAPSSRPSVTETTDAEETSADIVTSSSLGSTNETDGTEIISPIRDNDAAAPSCDDQCSPDLRAVWDCSGEIKHACQDGWACLDGKCIQDACRAADANLSSIGCEYWALRPDLAAPSTQGACFAVIVANTWTAPVTIDVEWKGEHIERSDFIRLPRGTGAHVLYEPFDPEVGLAPGDVALLFLGATNKADSPFPGCPVPPYIAEQTGVLGTSMGDAFRIRTNGPVVAYSAVPYAGSGASSSYSLLLPTSRWGVEYVALNAYAASEQVEAGAGGKPSLNILAQEDNTRVTMVPRVDVLGSDVVPAGVRDKAYTVTLNRGQYLQITQAEELTGSPVASDKPIAVWGAHSCMNIPVATHACDSSHQQLPPTPAMGTQYVGVRYPNRSSATEEERPPWRVVGAVDGTKLTWVGTFEEAMPSSLASGEVFEFLHVGGFVVSSQDKEHPFYLGQYMTSATHVAERAQVGDPEWVNVVPTDQYLQRYLFFTDPTFPETHLVIVRKPNLEGKYADVTLGCSGVLDGWAEVGEFQFTTRQIGTGYFEGVDGCANGVQTLESEGLFTVTAWGWGNETITAETDTNSAFNSYAFPAAVGLRTINTVKLRERDPRLR